MTIAIIGTGNIGAGLARVLAAAGKDIIVADSKGGADAAATLGLRAASVADAVRAADTVILATPYGAAASLAAEADFAGKTVIDVSNPVTADFSALQVGHTTSAAEEIAKLLPGATVVKAFNTVFAQHYAGDLTVGGAKIQTFVASDDEAARKAVVALAADAGFAAREAGPLSNARYLEGVGYMNIQFGYMLGLGTGLAPAWIG